jgi:hypothetical protein
MGNAESGPEATSPSHYDGNKSAVTSSSIVYCGGKAKAVTDLSFQQTPRLEEGMRQEPVAPHKVNFETTGREKDENILVDSLRGNSAPFQSISNQHPVALGSRIHHLSMPLQLIPVEKIPKYPTPLNGNQDWETKQVLKFNNSILRSAHEEDTDDDEESEISKLYKNISKLGTEVIEATAAVYYYLETKSMDDEMTVAGRANTVLQIIKRAAERGDIQPAYKFLETAKAVSEVLDEEDDIDENVDDGDSQLSMFRLLKDVDERRSISDQSVTLTRLLEETGSLNGGGSIFRILGEDEVVRHSTKQNTRNVEDPSTTTSIWNTVNVDCDDDCLPLEILPACARRAQTTEKARGVANSNPPLSYERDKYEPGPTSRAEETDDEQNQWTTNDLYAYREDLDDYVRSVGSQVDLTDLPHMHSIEATMDLEFVEYFDIAFNEFIAAYPEFLTDHPDLIHNLRILKLQKLLEYNDSLERDLKEKIERLQTEKESMEQTMHDQLKDAARKKAARQTFLQSELNNLSWSTKRVQTQLRWKFLQYSEDRVKRQFKMRQQFKAIPHAHTRQDLIALIPEGVEGNRLKDVVQDTKEEPKSFMLSAEDENQLLREYQAENSVMSAELATLTNKVTALQMEAKTYAWVESVLVRLDEGTLYKLKDKFQKKEGTSIL